MLIKKSWGVANIDDYWNLDKKTQAAIAYWLSFERTSKDLTLIYSQWVYYFLTHDGVNR